MKYDGISNHDDNDLAYISYIYGKFIHTLGYKNVLGNTVMDDRSPTSRHGHNIKEGTCSSHPWE